MPNEHSNTAKLPTEPKAILDALRHDLPSLVRDAVRAELEDARRVNAETETLLTKEGVAARLNVSPRTVDTLAASGELPRLKIRGCVRFHPDAVDAFIRNRC